MKTIRKTVVRSAAVFLLLALMVFAGTGILEAAICWDAFRRCAIDPINTVVLTGGLYCLNGYVFCIKYIDPPK